jgi:hypothetical protein
MQTNTEHSQSPCIHYIADYTHYCCHHCEVDMMSLLVLNILTLLVNIPTIVLVSIPNTVVVQ